jgi:hypothetical protein
VDGAPVRLPLPRPRARRRALTAFFEKVLGPQPEFPLDPDFAAGFFELSRRLGDSVGRPAFVKGQVTGPLTFLLGLNLEDGRPVYSDPELRGRRWRSSR